MSTRRVARVFRSCCHSNDDEAAWFSSASMDLDRKSQAACLQPTSSISLSCLSWCSSSMCTRLAIGLAVLLNAAAMSVEVEAELRFGRTRTKQVMCSRVAMLLVDCSGWCCLLRRTSVLGLSMYIAPSKKLSCFVNEGLKRVPWCTHLCRCSWSSCFCS